MSPGLQEAGHIDFGADPVGVGVAVGGGVGVMLSCLHNILWTSGWILFLPSFLGYMIET